jgi:Rod binding domain-containing protein
MAIDTPMVMPARPQLPVATPEQRARINQAAQAFEAQLLSLMMQPMFEGLSTSPPFGGGESEGTFRSFLMDAIGKQTARAGGVGVAKVVSAEMLKLQGLQ